jgi:hypothetical protein
VFRHSHRPQGKENGMFGTENITTDRIMAVLLSIFIGLLNYSYKILAYAYCFGQSSQYCCSTSWGDKCSYECILQVVMSLYSV